MNCDRIRSGILVAFACFTISDVNGQSALVGKSKHDHQDAALAALAQPDQGDNDSAGRISQREFERSVVVLASPMALPTDRDSLELETEYFLSQTSPIRRTTLLQPTPFLEPKVLLTPIVPSSSSLQQNGASFNLTMGLTGTRAVPPSLFKQSQGQVDAFLVDRVYGQEAFTLSTTDIGSLLKKSPSALSTDVQRRTPIVNDPRIRSSRVGSLAASGSHWVPARADLDTAVSKIDSRLIDEILIVPGPYSSLYGPGFSFADFTLAKSPRSDGGLMWSGRTSFDHNSNGNQWLGQQGFWGGGTNWGARFNYSHRTGGDYRAGDGGRVAANYESREFAIALGRDLKNGDSVEASILRLDQTDVEFPGYVFDIDVLVTDGYEITYTENAPLFSERRETEFWYNRTRFHGNAQSAAKTGQFPLLDAIAYQGFTDVDSLSTGYRRALQWGQQDDFSLTIGHDLRFIKQELNEISSGQQFGAPNFIVDANSPIPRSYSANPGLFAQYSESFLDTWTVQAGARIDFAQTDITEDIANLQQLTFELPNNRATLAEILGDGELQTERILLSMYSVVQHRYSKELVGSVSLGYAERAPTLTELYAVQPFLLLLQNGLNTVTGDPELDEEKLIQMDFAFDYQSENLRAGFRAFQGWSFDYVTFENLSTFRAGLNNEIQQVALRYVNTDLATMAGFESYLELQPNSSITPFARIKYVDGRDRTRNGDFATNQGQDNSPVTQVAGLPRGAFSFVSGSDSEPLPGISPLETRLGFRFSDTGTDSRWNAELSARVVNGQDRVASSLFESPTPGFTTWDARAFYRPRRIEGLLLVTGVENFTDKSYREHLDFRSFAGQSLRQPGINCYVGVDLTY